MTRFKDPADERRIETLPRDFQYHIRDFQTDVRELCEKYYVDEPGTLINWGLRAGHIPALSLWRVAIYEKNNKKKLTNLMHLRIETIGTPQGYKSLAAGRAATVRNIVLQLSTCVPSILASVRHYLPEWAWEDPDSWMGLIPAPHKLAAEREEAMKAAEFASLEEASRKAAGELKALQQSIASLEKSLKNAADRP